LSETKHIRVQAEFQKGKFISRTSYSCTVDSDLGGWAWLQVKVWDLRLGATFEEAVAKGCGGYGQSELFYARGTPFWDIYPGRHLVGLKSFSVLEPVPEADVGALVAVGCVALWWWRRRIADPAQHPLQQGRPARKVCI